MMVEIHYRVADMSPTNVGTHKNFGTKVSCDIMSSTFCSTAGVYTDESTKCRRHVDNSLWTRYQNTFPPIFTFFLLQVERNWSWWKYTDVDDMSATYFRRHPQMFTKYVDIGMSTTMSSTCRRHVSSDPTRIGSGMSATFVDGKIKIFYRVPVEELFF